ncbi:pyroglutamyl-peptidase 1-like [Liolophura sinensis]|uniref:pyroglutamyl-peptidase 1-like n=1 Tax=Liolophura sinensis TaxID=3198878 RepID=UPI0031590AFA
MGSCEERNRTGSKPVVLVTGFGPFGMHQVNASWVAVSELGKLGITDDVDLIVQEVPVEYEAVKKIVPALWQKHKPSLVVHVGVSGIASELTLEQQAHNDGYCKEDVQQLCPSHTCCVHGAENTIISNIDMQTVCDEVNRSSCGVKAVVSHDPGRYLCDFCYYQSLFTNRHRSAFIHVPPLAKPYTASELAQGIKAAILSMLKQITS